MLLAAELFARRGGDEPRFIFPFLLLLALGGLAFWLIRRRRGGDPAPPTDPPSSAGPTSAMLTLAERFARGDIDRAEFEHRKAVLNGATSVPPVAPPAPAPSTPPAPAPPAPPAATATLEPDTPVGEDGSEKSAEE